MAFRKHLVVRHFRGAEDFGIALLTPKEFLESIGEIKG